MPNLKSAMLFEVSWEVCNKVGGIYTVVKSKAALMKDKYSEYFLIGPYFESSAKVELEEREPEQYLKEIFERLRAEGIVCHYGSWQIPGEPDAILVDFKGAIGRKNEIKTELWNHFRIDSLRSAWDFEEPVIWSWAVSRLLEEIAKARRKGIIAHFHEWLAGTALLQLKKNSSRIATVFTTHATMLGRAIAGSGEDLYAILPRLNPVEKAYNFGVQDKFLAEKACAQNADIFTTVSEITGIEAEKIFEKKPDMLLPNGLDVAKFPTVEEFSIKHITCRERIREFLTFYFFPYYSFDINNTMLMFTTARYEFKNKGLDIFIKALAKINDRLKEEKSSQTIAVFFWIPQDVRGIKTEVLENKNFYRHIKNVVLSNSDSILSNIVYDLVSGKDIVGSQLFTKEFLLTLRKNILRFKRAGNAPIVTHYISDENSDPIMRALIDSGLDNKPDDNVKAILHPVYLDGTDGLVDLSYYDAMAGCHLGVFASYYEPWGYTPMESAALGVPAVTSDLAGFGRFIQPKLKASMDDGIFVLKRHGRSDEDAVNDFAELLYSFSKRDRHTRAANKIDAKRLSGLADWEILVENYLKAHEAALKKE